jgi:hypothetical protein
MVSHEALSVWWNRSVIDQLYKGYQPLTRRLQWLLVDRTKAAVIVTLIYVTGREKSLDGPIFRCHMVRVLGAGFLAKQYIIGKSRACRLAATGPCRL